MQHHSTVIVESKLAPGVRYTLHRPNDVRRSILARTTAESKERLARFITEARALVAGPQEACNATRFETVLQLAGAETVTLGAAHVLCFLQGTEGLLIDGKIPTPTDFIANAPDAIRKEVITEIQTLLFAADEQQPGNPALLVN
jgi:hypothetical protein